MAGSDDKDKKKKGPVPPWVSGAARGPGASGAGSWGAAGAESVSSGLSAGAAGSAEALGQSAASVVRATGLRGFLQTLRMGLGGGIFPYLGSAKVLVPLTVAAGLALGVMLPLSKSGGMRSGSRVRIGAGDGGVSDAVLGNESAGPSSLRLAQLANEGALGVPVDPDEAADAAADDAVDVDDEWVEDAGYAADLADKPEAEEEPEDAARAAAAPKGKLARSLGGMSKLSGLGGVSGGTSARLTTGGGALKTSAQKPGQLGSMSKSRKMARTRGKKSSRRGTKGLGTSSLARLKKMNKAMAGAGKNPETAAATHSNAWEGSPGAGGGLQGSGGSGVGSDPGGSSTGVSEEGPIENGSPEEKVDDADKYGGENKTPYQGMMMAAMGLIALASVMLLVAYVLGNAAKAATLPPVAAALYAKAKMCAYVAMALAGVATLIGGAIIGMYNQMMQGGIIAGAGGLLTIISYSAAEGFDQRATAAKEAAAANAAPEAEAIHANLGAGMPQTEQLGNQTITTDYFDMG